MARLLLILSMWVAVAGKGEAHAAVQKRGAVVVDDFESEAAGKAPSRWEYFTRKGREFISLKGLMAENERFYVVADGGRKFLRTYTKGEAHRISMGNGQGVLDWSLESHPTLSWQWRALQLPEGAREDKVNDTGAAVYVTFDKKDWLGRPYSIKYTYSSTLPRGKEVDSGNVKVIVVSSGAESIGRWVTVERDVAADYRRLFGSAPPDRPFSITLWSDSDDTRGEAEADFDNIRLLP